MTHLYEEYWRALVEHIPDIVMTLDRDGYILSVNRAPAGLHAQDVLGKPLLDYVEPEYRAQVQEALTHVLRTGAAGDYEIKARGPHGSPTWYEARAQPIVQNGAVTRVLVVARDLSTLAAAEALLRDNEARIQGVSVNLPGMVFQLLHRHDDPLLRFVYVSDGARALCGIPPEAFLDNADHFTGLLHEDDGAAFHRGLRASAATLSTWRWEGRLLTPHAGEQWVELRATPRRAGAGETLWDGIVLNVTDAKRQQLETAKSREMLRELSAHAESAREKERARIAREIHDELGQALTAMSMQVALLRKRCAAQSDVAEQLSSLRELIDRTLNSVRAIATDLRPAVLDLGLVTALEWLAQEFHNRTGIRCRFEHGDEPALDKDLATALFRIAQESLTNVARHAHAHHVRLTLNYDDTGWLRLEVNDDGIGLDVLRAAEAKSFGLRGIRERVQMLGGIVAIDGQPGSGTLIRVSIPVHQGAKSS